jgi:hypothetical protein
MIINNFNPPKKDYDRSRIEEMFRKYEEIK